MYAQERCHFSVVSSLSAGLMCNFCWGIHYMTCEFLDLLEVQIGSIEKKNNIIESACKCNYLHINVMLL